LVEVIVWRAFLVSFFLAETFCDFAMIFGVKTLLGIEAK
jgi:hypothetical protein